MGLQQGRKAHCPFYGAGIECTPTHGVVSDSMTPQQNLRDLIRSFALATLGLATVFAACIFVLPLLMEHLELVAIAGVTLALAFNLWRARKLPKAILLKTAKTAITYGAVLIPVGYVFGELQSNSLLNTWTGYSASTFPQSSKLLTRLYGLSFSCLFWWMASGLVCAFVGLRHGLQQLPLRAQSFLFSALNDKARLDAVVKSLKRQNERIAPYKGFGNAAFIMAGCLAIFAAHFSESLLGARTAYSRQIHHAINILDFQSSSMCENVHSAERSLFIGEGVVLIARPESPWKFERRPCKIQFSE